MEKYIPNPIWALAGLYFFAMIFIIIYGINHPKEFNCYFDDGKRWDARYSEWVQLHTPCYKCNGKSVSIEQYNKMK